MKNIPAIKTTEKTQAQLDLEAQRAEWEKEYEYWLKRKNKKSLALAAQGRTQESSPKYMKLKAKVQEIWQKLHDTKPQWIPPNKKA